MVDKDKILKKLFEVKFDVNYLKNVIEELEAAKNLDKSEQELVNLLKECYAFELKKGKKGLSKQEEVEYKNLKTTYEMMKKDYKMKCDTNYKKLTEKCKKEVLEELEKY